MEALFDVLVRYMHVHDDAVADGATEAEAWEAADLDFRMRQQMATAPPPEERR